MPHRNAMPTSCEGSSVSSRFGRLHPCRQGHQLGQINDVRPFRAPHHTIPDVGLIGGALVPLPGEVSLAHHGILLLDELPECKGHVLGVFNHSRGVLQEHNFAGALDLTALAALAKLGERKNSPID